MKKLIVASLVAATIGVAAMPAAARTDIIVNLAPPAPRYEVVPAPRSGYVWSNGNWQYDGRQHVWAAGEWQPVRQGYVYSQPRWVENNGRWAYQGSRWDRDGDGVPNRMDAAPNNPNRN
jgi:hypothetical protein